MQRSTIVTLSLHIYLLLMSCCIVASPEAMRDTPKENVKTPLLTQTWLGMASPASRTEDVELIQGSFPSQMR